MPPRIVSLQQQPRYCGDTPEALAKHRKATDIFRTLHHSFHAQSPSKRICHNRDTTGSLVWMSASSMLLISQSYNRSPSLLLHSRLLLVLILLFRYHLQFLHTPGWNHAPSGPVKKWIVWLYVLGTRHLISPSVYAPSSSPFELVTWISNKKEHVIPEILGLQSAPLGTSSVSISGRSTPSKGFLCMFRQPPGSIFGCLHQSLYV
jgi:hypothetical protein